MTDLHVIAADPTTLGWCDSTTLRWWVTGPDGEMIARGIASSPVGAQSLDAWCDGPIPADHIDELHTAASELRVVTAADLE